MSKEVIQTFCAGYVIVAAAILMTVSVAGSALIRSTPVIASVDNTIEEEKRVAV
jgi:hypothetical protein